MGEKEKIRENYGKGRRNTGKTHVKEILIFTIGQEHILGKNVNYLCTKLGQIGR